MCLYSLDQFNLDVHIVDHLMEMIIPNLSIKYIPKMFAGGRKDNGQNIERTICQNATTICRSQSSYHINMVQVHHKMMLHKAMDIQKGKKVMTFSSQIT